MCNARAWTQQCWRSCANGSNVVALRFGHHGTKEMLGVAGSKVWLVSNFAQQLPTTCNRVCKRPGRVTSKNVGSCWPTMLRPFAWDLTLMTAIAFLTFSLPSPSWFSAWATKYTRQKYWTYSEIHDFKYDFLSAVSISFPQEWKH